ncbi:ParM/StbA family protein [Bacillus cereus]|uniref:ParM/StbA family protein n=1 Tax=Bacillus cereus group TaxID=86661 RepID=UPI002406791D|nr:ParM/StbA family protein [Bacillus cereus]MDF9530630.1 ParM/StbA family protein [Bacillus cereus]MDG1578904.1 ParM/StbA family protein [Bacillus cereus]
MMMRTVADIGNSELKMMINGELVKQQNVNKRIFGRVKNKEGSLQQSVANLMDEICVHVTSDAIERDGKFYVGYRAAHSNGKPDALDIELGDKHKRDLPVVNVLSVMASKAVQTIYNEVGELPKNIEIPASLILAIPASEYEPAKARFLESRFMDNEHVVIVYLGEEKVTVQITFEIVRVTREGVPALYAIFEGNSDMFTDFSKLYDLENIDGQYFKDKKVLHADIGDGTSEYIYSDGLNPVPDACWGEKRGIGHAIEGAIKLLQEEYEGGVDINRQQFSELVTDSNDKKHDKAVEFLEETRYMQAQGIYNDIEKSYIYKTSSKAEVLAVYGGGSIALKDDLYKKALEFCKINDIQLLWIPQKYATEMNVRGMEILSDKLVSKVTKK